MDSNPIAYPRIGPAADAQTAIALARAVAAEHRQSPLIGHGAFCDVSQEARDFLYLALVAADRGHTVEMTEPEQGMFQRHWRCVTCGRHATLGADDCPPPVEAGQVQVTIFHAAGRPGGRRHARHPVARVLSYTACTGPDACRPLLREYVTVDRVAEHALILSGSRPARLFGEEQQFAGYYARGLRAIQYGDRAQVGDIVLAYVRHGWRVVTPAQRGSRAAMTSSQGPRPLPGHQFGRDCRLSERRCAASR